MTDKIFQLFTVTSLEKIFSDEPFSTEYAVARDTRLQGERYNFQAAFCLEKGEQLVKARVLTSGPLAPYALVRLTGMAPSQLPNYPDGDSFVLRTRPGLYPDPLYPFDGRLTLIPGQWRSLWITIPSDCPLPAGDYSLTVTFVEDNPAEADSGAERVGTVCGPDHAGAAVSLGSCTFTLHILNAALPEQTLIHTQWLHTDCIADRYQTPVFSERWWELTERYLECASVYGINMLLTPLFTPPLDTAPGGERTTVQLIDVYRTPEGYRFGMEKLERWIAMCGRRHIRYLEFSHLFTQWGAGHAPKIMAYEGAPGQLPPDAEPVRIFGWETSASGEDYRAFLEAFLPCLMEFIRSRRLEQQCFFHISDEPHRKHLPAYLRARELVKRLIKDLPIMDAVSDYDYYEQKIIDLPVCSSDHLEPFLEHQAAGLWTYYCCAQHREVSNRFFNMPSVRNRILGVQLYKYNIKGFLHWGFNFWNSALSLRRLDPFCETDAGCAFASGDAFLVYPGADGPIGSLRGEVFTEALQDMRMLQLLEALTDAETVAGFIDEDTERPLTFKQYPHDMAWLLKLREKVHKEIMLRKTV